MILKKTLLALSCTVLLTACGGGGSSSSDGTSNNGGSGETTNPSNPAADLAKAKQLISTTNNIIAYFDSFEGLQSQYEPAFDAVSDAGNDISNASNLIVTLASLAQKDAQGSTKEYTPAQLEALLKAEMTYDGEYYPDYILTIFQSSKDFDKSTARSISFCCVDLSPPPSITMITSPCLM